MMCQLQNVLRQLLKLYPLYGNARCTTHYPFLLFLALHTPSHNALVWSTGAGRAAKVGFPGITMQRVLIGTRGYDRSLPHFTRKQFEGVQYRLPE